MSFLEAQFLCLNVVKRRKVRELISHSVQRISTLHVNLWFIIQFEKYEFIVADRVPFRMKTSFYAIAILGPITFVYIFQIVV